MKDFCGRFQKSILFLFELIIYLGNYAVFFLLLGIDNKQLLVLSRTSVVITFTWIIISALLTVIYGKYDVGVRKSRPIVISLSLTAVMTDVAAYLLLNIMNRNEDNNQTFKIEFVGYFLLILVIHIVLITFMTYAGNGFYFWVSDPEAVLLITSSDTSVLKLKTVIGKYHKRYRIERIADYRDADLKERIRSADSVFLYDLPVSERTEIVNYCNKH